MTTRRPSMEELNAYVDGELPAPDSARVARALALHPDLADRVALLSKLKASVEASQQEAPAITLKSSARQRLRKSVAAVAACLVLALGLLAFVSTQGWDDPPGLTTYAWALHDDWVEATSGASAAAAPPLVEASLTALGPGLFVPDLSDARLTVGHLSLVDSRFGKGLHVGYMGTRGCRLSLLVMPRTEDEAAKTPEPPSQDRRFQAWRSGDFTYLLLATGMDPRHFATVASTTRDAVRRQQPLAQQERMALRDSRARSRPCLV